MVVVDESTNVPLVQRPQWALSELDTVSSITLPDTVLAVAVLEPPPGSASEPGGPDSPISFGEFASVALAPAGSVIRLAGARNAPPSLGSDKLNGSKNDPTIAM